MAKKVFYGDDARQRILGGARLLYEAVKTTMGPKGQNVIIEQDFNPTVTHDGVTVAKGVEVDNEDDETLGYKIGAELIKKAADKMNDIAGDGTTTVTVLTYHILNEANKLITAGHNPMMLRRGIEDFAKKVINSLEEMSEDIDTPQRLVEVATISAGDKEIGKLIAEIMDEVGKDSTVTIEDGQGLELESEVVEGFTLDKGYISPYMVTDSKRMEAVYKNPVVLLTDQKITAIKEILPLLEKITQAGIKELLIIADDVNGEALKNIVLNKLKGNFFTVAVKAPLIGTRRTEILTDIAKLTGATVIGEDTGVSFANADLSVLGKAKKVIVSHEKTVIVEGSGDKEDVKNRVKEITEQVSNAKNKAETDYYEQRRAALQNKVAVIKVGGATETEIEEKKYRVEDAVAAVKAALHDGIVPGGGVTLVNIAQSFKIKGTDSTDIGAQILQKALYQPFRILIENAGLSPDEWLSKLKQPGIKMGYGVNVANPEEYLIDLKKAGVIDPTRVTKEAIQNSVSIAATAITMGALVVNKPTSKKEKA